MRKVGMAFLVVMTLTNCYQIPVPPEGIPFPTTPTSPEPIVTNYWCQSAVDENTRSGSDCFLDPNNMGSPALIQSCLLFRLQFIWFALEPKNGGSPNGTFLFNSVLDCIEQNVPGGVITYTDAIGQTLKMGFDPLNVDVQLALAGNPGPCLNAILACYGDKL